MRTIDPASPVLEAERRRVDADIILASAAVATRARARPQPWFIDERLMLADLKATARRLGRG